LRGDRGKKTKSDQGMKSKPGKQNMSTGRGKPLMNGLLFEKGQKKCPLRQGKVEFLPAQFRSQERAREKRKEGRGGGISNIRKKIQIWVKRKL